MDKWKSFFLVAILLSSLFFTLSYRSVLASNQIYWGGWFGGSDGITADENRMPMSVVQTFGNIVGKQPAIWNWVEWWSNSEDTYHSAFFKSAWMDEARINGMIPMVSWSPNSANGQAVAQGFYDLQSILEGKCDSYLQQWGQASAQWGHPYFVRLMWEFNGDWTKSEGIYPYGSSAQGTSSENNTPQKYVQAWQYIVSHVRAAGGTQITWVWCPASIGDSAETLQAVYPGDAYVDWVATDVYPYPTSLTSGFGRGTDIEMPNIHVVAPTKPFMFAELGDPNPVWWKDFLNQLPSKYPFIQAVVLWEEPTANVNTVVSPSNMLESFSQGISSNYFSSNVYDNLSSSPIPALVGNFSSFVWPTVVPQFLSVTPVFTILFVGASFLVAAGLVVVFIFRKRSRQKVI